MSLETLHQPCTSLQLLDVPEPLVELADVAAHVAGEEGFDHTLSLPEAIADGGLMPSLEVVELALLETIPEPSV